MIKQTFLERITNWFKGLSCSKKKIQENNDDEIKREMCRKAVQSGVCPHTCDICAWNTLIRK